MHKLFVTLKKIIYSFYTVQIPMGKIYSIITLKYHKNFIK